MRFAVVVALLVHGATVPWGWDAASIANRAMVKKFAEEVVASDAWAKSLLAQLTRTWKSTFKDKRAAVDRAVRTAQTVVTGLELDTNRLLEAAETSVSKLNDPITIESARFKVYDKAAKKQQYTAQKEYDKSTKTLRKSFKNFQKAVAKQSKNFVKQMSKKLDKGKKDGGKRLKKVAKTLAKTAKGLTKQISKLKDQLVKNWDGIDDETSQISFNFDDATSSADDIQEGIDRKLEHLLYSEDVANMGLEPAMDRAVDLQEKTEDRAVSNIDRVLEIGGIRLRDVEQALADQLAEGHGKLAKVSRNAEKEAEQFAKEANYKLLETARTVGDKQDELAAALASLTREQGRAGKELRKSQRSLDVVKGTASDASSTMFEDMKAMVENYGSYTSRAVQQVKEKIEDEIARVSAQARADGQRAARSLDSDAQKRSRDAEQQVAKVLEAEQHTLAKVSRQAAADEGRLVEGEQTAGQAEKKLADVGARVRALPEAAATVAAAARAGTEQVSTAAGAAGEAMNRAQTEAEAFLATQGQDVQKLVADTVLKMEGLLSNSATDVEQDGKDVQQGAAEARQKVQAPAQQATLKLKQALDQLERSQQSLKGMEQESVTQQDQTGEALDSLTREEDRLQEDVQKTARAKTAESEQAAKEAVTEVTEELGAELDRAADQRNSQQQSGREALEQVETAEADRESSWASKSKVLAAQIQDLQGGTSKTEQGLRSAHDARMQSLEAEAKAIERLPNEMSKDRGEMKRRVMATVQEVVQRLGQTGGAKITELMDTQEKGSEAQQQEFDRQLESGRTDVARAVQELQAQLTQLEDGVSQTSGQLDHVLDGKPLGWEKEAENALAQLGAASAKLTAKRATLEKEIAAARAHASGNLTTLTEHRQDLFARAQETVQGLLKSLQSMSEEELQAFAREAEKAQSQVRTKASAAAAEDARLARSIQAQQRSVEAASGRFASQAAGLAQQVSADERKWADEVGARQQQDALDSAKGRAETAKLSNELELEEARASGAAKNFGHKVEAEVAALNPAGALRGANAEIGELKRAEARAEATVTEKADEVQKGADDLAQELSTLTRQEGTQLDAVGRAVMDAAANLHGSFLAAGSDLNRTRADVMALVSEAQGVVGLMESTLGARLAGIQQELAATKTDVDEAAGLQKYSEEGALEKVVAVLDGAQRETDALARERDEVVVPRVEAWRRDIERVFEQMGLGLDKERITRAAAEYLVKQTEGGLMDRSKAELEMKVHMLETEAAGKIAAVKAKADKMVAEIMAMENLSAEEKERRIRAVREAASGAVRQLKSSADALVAKEMALSRELDADMEELNSLLERAKQLEGSQDPAAMERTIQDLDALLRKKLATLRTHLAAPSALVELAERRAESRRWAAQLTAAERVLGLKPLKFGFGSEP